MRKEYKDMQEKLSALFPFKKRCFFALSGQIFGESCE